MTESPSWMDVEPSGIMISPPRATTATRIPGFRDRSRRGVPQMAGGGGDGKLHGLGGPIRDAVQSVHHAALGVLHPPDHLENVGGGQLLGRDDAVQTNGLGDTVVVLPVGFGDDFGKAQLGGVQGDDEVVFIPVGKSHEGITGGEVL